VSTFFVRFGTKKVLNSRLESGDEPGRLVEDDVGRVHVALRRGGAVVSIDPATGAILARRPVCGAPRGIAFDAGSRSLKVACDDGVLVMLPQEGSENIQRVPLEPGLRDVIVADGRTFVSTFKRAQLLEVDAQGELIGTHAPAPTHNFISEKEGSRLVDTLQPEVAWRTVRGADGGLMMLHQGARKSPIQVDTPDPLKAAPQVYYGSSSCGSVVQSVLTQLDGSAHPLASLRIAAALAVDVAVSPVDGTIAVAHAGRPDPEQPHAGPNSICSGPSFGPRETPAVSLVTPGQFQLGLAEDQRRDACLAAPQLVAIAGQITAVAFTPNGLLVAQRRDPAALIIPGDASGVATYISLGGTSVRDTGHELFHRDTGAGIACASCHPEGGEDGHVWMFSDVGARRTQALHVGLRDTAPFHWAGELTDMTALVDDVMVSRMSGVHQSPARIAALETWLYELHPPLPRRLASDAAAQRGRMLFEADTGCAKCHAGAEFTNNKNEDVGTGGPLQVPSLVGIGYRAPFMHTGCAATLRDRFTPECGGTKHGQTERLTPAQIDDLVAYLETL
jgi:mono/diheme cytochrome c family protein